MEYENIYQQTVQLINITNKANEQYNQRRETGEKGDFYQEVKPFADQSHVILNQWKKEASDFLIHHPKKNIHQNQIAATAENLELIVVQCFFPETSYKRFKSYVQSSLYVLEQLRDLLISHSSEE